MKFSIVTPNYNYGRFLRKALESVLAQVNDAASGGMGSRNGPPPGRGRPPDGQPLGRDRPPGGPTIEIEHIVIDGGSTDDSVQILKDWAASSAASPAAKAGRYTFSYVSEPDQGQTDAINKGLRRATGDIVAWLNADEYYLPGKLQLVAAFLAKHPKADFVYGEPLFVNEDGTPLRVKWDHSFSKFVLLYHDCHIASCCSFWRRELLDTDGYLDTSRKVAMDYEYWCRLVRHRRRFSFVPHVIGAFVWHEGNVSRAFAERGKQEVFCVKRTYANRFSANVMRTAVGRFLLDSTAHQWRRVLVLLRLVFMPRDVLS